MGEGPRWGFIDARRPVANDLEQGATIRVLPRSKCIMKAMVLTEIGEETVPAKVGNARSISGS